jgi:hypothetical protein
VKLALELRHFILEFLEYFGLHSLADPNTSVMLSR